MRPGPLGEGPGPGWCGRRVARASGSEEGTQRLSSGDVVLAASVHSPQTDRAIESHNQARPALNPGSEVETTSSGSAHSRGGEEMPGPGVSLFAQRQGPPGHSQAFGEALQQQRVPSEDGDGVLRATLGSRQQQPGHSLIDRVC